MYNLVETLDIKFSMKKMYIQLKGGLGNQLYIVATGLSISKSLGIELIADSSFFNSYKLHNVTVNKFIKDLVIKDMSLKIKDVNIFNFKKKLFYTINESKIGFDKLILEKVEKKNNFLDLYLIGYFQSVNYFKDSLDELKQKINKNILKEFPELKSKKVKDILDNSIAIHIRRKDKLSDINKKIYGNISKEEIIRIVQSIYKKNKYKYLLLIGDDFQFIEDLQKELFTKFNSLCSYSINKHSSIMHDFYYLMNCKGLILNNSSFGLWAGYLSDSTNIFYPNPLFPEPLHQNIKSLCKDDIILKEWKAYEMNYDM